MLYYINITNTVMVSMCIKFEAGGLQSRSGQFVKHKSLLFSRQLNRDFSVFETVVLSL